MNADRTAVLSKLRSTLRRRRLAARLCIGLVVLINAACARDRAGSAPDASTYTVLVPASDWTARLARDGAAKLLLFLELATPNADGVLEGVLAESWEHSPDYREWTIHLRTDVRWHDGVPVTAHDIKFTVDLWNHPDVLYTNWSKIESVEVLDDSTFIMTYKPGTAWHTYWYPGYFLVFYPKHLLEDLDPVEFYQWDFWKQPVGNGPFRYVRHTPKIMVEFEANPDFYLGVPKIERVVLKFGPESITELLAGNVDALNLENQIAVEMLKGDPRFNVYYESWDDISAMTSFLYNHRNPLFGDARVRRAMAHAIDRHELKRVLNMWEDLPVVDVPFTESQYWKRELPEPLAYDPALARRLLEEAGWRDGDGDGVRERDGEEFSFPLIVAERYQPAAVYVQHKLGEVGVEVKITTLDRSVVWERTYETRDFEVAIAGVWASPDDPDMGLEVMMGKNSAIGFHNARATELVSAAMEATDLESLGSIYRELAPIIQEEQPYTFLIFGVETYVAHRRIKGLSSPFRANPLWSAGHLWIEKKR